MKNKAIKLKGLWCLTVKNDDGEVEVYHLIADRKPSLKRAVMSAYQLEKNDEVLMGILSGWGLEVVPVILYNEHYVKIEPVKISV
jgi:hypothetical protein